MSNDPTKWSIEVRLRGNELSLILEALEQLRESRDLAEVDRLNEIEEIYRALLAKWEANA